MWALAGVEWGEGQWLEGTLEGFIVWLLVCQQTWHLLESHWVSVPHMKASSRTSALSSHLPKR